MFHHALPIMISNAEDKTIRLWDSNKFTSLHVYKRENDRLFTLLSDIMQGSGYWHSIQRNHLSLRGMIVDSFYSI